ncbi:MAG: hypothetical protein LBD63_03685 [Mycoplasmataceae bacterium]|jgi:uridine kinase|nr:hypothetical protein [Mycoplasmataceae bacterium]
MPQTKKLKYDNLIYQVFTRKCKNPFMVSIAGGSATGKTTHVTRELFNLFTTKKLQPVIINQDNFQIGRPFVNTHQSRYKWDDPDNFDLKLCHYTLKKLIDTHVCLLPIFDLKQTCRIGTKLVKIQSNKNVILFEGLYSFFDENLLELANFRIFVQAHFYARMIRRIFRFIYDFDLPQFDVAVKQMVLKVELANKEQVSRQRTKADLIITSPYSFTQTLNHYQLKSRIIFAPPLGVEIYRIEPEENLQILITLHHQQHYFNLTYKNINYYQAKISYDVVRALSQIDPYSFD